MIQFYQYPNNAIKKCQEESNLEQNNKNLQYPLMNETSRGQGLIIQNAHSIPHTIGQFQTEDEEELKDKSCEIQLSSEETLKSVEYQVTNICRFKAQCFEAFYLLGEIFVDFTQKEKSLEDKTSFWNQCKQWTQGVIDFDNRILTFQLDSKTQPLQDVNKYKKRYLSYPDQTIHSLFQIIEYYLSVQNQILQMQKLYCQQIKQNENLQGEMCIRKIMFDNYVKQYLTTFQKDEMYIGANIGPNLEKECFLSYNTFVSEAFCMLLGRSLSQMNELYQRNGGYNYLDYESNMEINKKVIKKLLIDVYKLPNLPEFITFEDTNKPFKLKFITYDEMTFYADVQLKILSLQDIIPQSSVEFVSDFSMALLKIDVSATTLQQIISLRQNSIQYESDIESINYLEYTLLSEIFQKKMGELKIQKYQKKQ
ncbi:hypothetical protein TTHERM_00307680 (macronuclear) [Tetrahymena thermophila SB210]|uniref:Uncharacterized protein n=1 Tax=Tetrahymena thermophila (strain SB210) TaxID=312017 RepID=I7M951_TETTS|nr:hypothetical protein TTHERM_00307680 [Tetrahymena thermophila SB210]EAS00797.1 hypothetical protein TTHERM_00307680 [Tetrahymena thermophila SB210]|eukprot:XP_001021042.1 hypothetical protein TTHERM_00307680 [Tetrahymena thermophila SB210]